MNDFRVSGVVMLLILSVSMVTAYEYKPVELGSPDGFVCHPSWAYFTADTMAADFTAERTMGDAPFTVMFFDISYGHPDYWEWDFGDGNKSYDQHPVYTYLEPGSYDVSLTIKKEFQYETTIEDYNRTGMGQLTDMSWSSTDRELDYITVAEPGSGTDQPYPMNFYPEPKNTVTMPSGLTGAVGNARFQANTVTITPTTQKGYTDSLNINGAYRLTKFTPYNDAF